MQYTLILTPQELQIISSCLREGPYRIVKPVLDNISQQVDIQNQPKETETPVQNTDN